MFVTGDYVYKIKKSVDFGFLDFTSLAKRKYYCEEELRLNRRLCPEIYLEVVPVALGYESEILGKLTREDKQSLDVLLEKLTEIQANLNPVS